MKGSVRDLGQSDLCKNIEKTGSMPCPFKEFQGRVNAKIEDYKRNVFFPCTKSVLTIFCLHVYLNRITFEEN
jgi:hypothetical protein